MIAQIQGTWFVPPRASVKLVQLAVRTSCPPQPGKWRNARPVVFPRLPTICSIKHIHLSTACFGGDLPGEPSDYNGATMGATGAAARVRASARVCVWFLPTHQAVAKEPIPLAGQPELQDRRKYCVADGVHRPQRARLALLSIRHRWRSNTRSPMRRIYVREGASTTSETSGCVPEWKQGAAVVAVAYLSSTQHITARTISLWCRRQKALHKAGGGSAGQTTY